MKYLILLLLSIFTININAIDYKKAIDTVFVEEYYAKANDTNYYRVVNDTEYRLNCYSFNVIQITDSAISTIVYERFIVGSYQKGEWLPFPANHVQLKKPH